MSADPAASSFSSRLGRGPVLYPTAGRRTGHDSAVGWWRRNVHAACAGLLTVLAAAAYCGYALVQYRTFRTSTYDLVIFDQAVRSYAHLQPGISAAKGMHNGPGPYFPVLGDHWSPVIAVLAPLYWLPGLDGPRTLLVAQGALFALAIPPVWMFARRVAGPRWGAATGYLAAGAYALCWPVAEAVAFGFHEVAFVPVLSAVFLERLEAGRVRVALLAAGALLLVKEDMGLLVAGFGLFVLAGRRGVPRRRSRWLLGAALIAGGIGAAVLATFVLRPAFGGRADYYWGYWSLGPNLPQAAGHALTHPLAAAQLLITPRVKLHTMLWLFGALLFLPLASPVSLAAVPLLAERMLASSDPGWWGVRYQYNAFLAVVLVCAAVDGAATLRRFAAWAGTRRLAAGRVLAGAGGLPAAIVPAAAGLACAAAVALVGRFAFGAALHPAFYQLTARDRGAAAAVAAVPPHVTVEAANRLGPQLSARTNVLLWDWYPRWAPWVAADTGQQTFPFTSLGAQLQRVALLERSGYRVVLARDGYIVLHR